MTIAVCVNCGSTKHGAFNPCDICNRRPENELDIAYSLALTDHYFSIDVLNQISADMRLGNARPSLPKEQEDHFREAARAHIERFGETFNLPPPNDPNMRRRCAKFAGWTRGARPAMISSLKWRAGFGWIALGLLLATCAAAIFSGGILRVLAVAAALLIGLLLIYLWHRWNGHGWPQIHHRAMLAYAQIAGWEAALAEQDRRAFSKTDACRSLALAIVRGRWRHESVDAMIAALAAERGAYFADLIERYGTQANPELDADAIRRIADITRKLDLGPQLVIGNIVENTFGGKEGARYVIALVMEKAQ